MGCGCGCPGISSVCAGPDPVAVRDGVHARRIAHQGGQRIGLLAVWPQETRDLILRINPSMLSTDAAVSTCTTLAPDEVAAWRGFFGAWKTFAAEEVTTFGSARKWDEAEAYRLQLAGWQDELSAKCKIIGPKLTAPDAGGNVPADLPSAIKWAAVAAIAVSLVYGIRTVLR